MEVNLLDEGTHVRQVRDAIETTVNENDTHQIIQILLEDLCHNGESSWHRRMASPTRSTNMSTVSSATGSHILRPSSPSASSAADWNDPMRTYASIDSRGNGHHARRMPITQNTYMPTNSDSSSNLASPSSPTSKPPLPSGPRRAYTANAGNIV